MKYLNKLIHRNQNSQRTYFHKTSEETSEEPLEKMSKGKGIQEKSEKGEENGNE